MKTYIHNLRRVLMWVCAEDIEKKGTSATLEELATYFEFRKILQKDDWSYERTIEVLKEIIQYWEELREK